MRILNEREVRRLAWREKWVPRFLLALFVASALTVTGVANVALIRWVARPACVCR